MVREIFYRSALRCDTILNAIFISMENSSLSQTVTHKMSLCAAHIVWSQEVGTRSSAGYGNDLRIIVSRLVEDDR